MKNELEQLVELALADGYVTEKERNVLRNKAEKLGYDPDEIDVILDGNLYIKTNKNKPKIRKCVSCGEVLLGVSKVCPACDYINEPLDDTDTPEKHFSTLKQLLQQFKMAKPKPGVVSNDAFRIMITSGLYIPYKLLLRRKPLFNRYFEINKAYVPAMDEEAEKLRRMYGSNPQLNNDINVIIAERDALIASRKRGDWFRVGINAAIYGLIILGIFAIANKPPAPETAEEKTERLIKEKKIGTAKEALAGVNDKYVKEELTNKLTRLEIDSLMEVRDYNVALKLANMLPTDYSSQFDRESAINSIIEKQVLELIEEKNFKLAYERADMATSLLSFELRDKIKLAEKLDEQTGGLNKEKKKHTKKK